MKTLIIRVKDVPAPRPYPVQLYFENGAQDWFRQTDSDGLLPRDPAPVQLAPRAGGTALPLEGIVQFLLTTPQSVGYTK